MTENEAIKELEEQISLYEWQAEDIDKVINPKRYEEYQNAISAFKTGVESLKEIQQYRSIGTVEELSKNMNPIKPITYTGTNRADCPVCGATVRGIDKPFGDFCSECGQKLDWSEVVK